MSKPEFAMHASRRGVLLSAASLLALSGCGSLIGPQGDPLRMYVLAPAVPQIAGRLPFQLAVGTPDASSSLATDRIALRRSDTLDYYANAQWTDGVPKLVQARLLEAFDTAGVAGAVARDTAGIHTDYILQTEIEHFEAQYDRDDGAPAARIVIAAKLLSVHGGAIAGAMTFSQQAQASANSVPAVVAAFDTALAAVLEQILRWVFASASHLPHAGP